MNRQRWPVVLGLVAAIGATAILVRLADLRGAPGASGESQAPVIARGQPTPPIVGTTLDGQPFDLASLRGRPVIVNFWGPTCEPCKAEFPLFKAKLDEHAADGLQIVGILMLDPPALARDFVSRYGASWPTVEDPGEAIRNAYRVAARPQSYFVDADGILRAIQVGEVTSDVFERQYALIAPDAGGDRPSPSIEIPPPQ